MGEGADEPDKDAEMAEEPAAKDAEPDRGEKDANRGPPLSAAKEKEIQLKRELGELHRQRREMEMRLRDLDEQDKNQRRNEQHGGGHMYTRAHSEAYTSPRNRSEPGFGDSPRSEKRPRDSDDKERDRDRDSDRDRRSDRDRDSDRETPAKRSRLSSVATPASDDKKDPDKLDDEPTEDKKPKLSSTIVSSNPVHVPGEKPSPKVSTDEKGTRRDRRLFGVLLGTLKRAAKDGQEDMRSAQAKKREQKEKEVVEKLEENRKKLITYQKGLLQDKKQSILERRKDLFAKLERKELQLLTVRWSQNHDALKHFIKTDAGPAIYYLPAKHNAITEAKLAEQAAQEKPTYDDIVPPEPEAKAEDDKEMKDEEEAAPAADKMDDGEGEGKAEPEKGDMETEDKAEDLDIDEGEDVLGAIGKD